MERGWILFVPSCSHATYVLPMLCAPGALGAPCPPPRHVLIPHPRSHGPSACSAPSTFPRRSFFFLSCCLDGLGSYSRTGCRDAVPLFGLPGWAEVYGLWPQTAPGPNPFKQPHLHGATEAAAPRYHQYNWKGHMLNPRCCSR